MNRFTANFSFSVCVFSFLTSVYQLISTFPFQSHFCSMWLQPTLWSSHFSPRYVSASPTHFSSSWHRNVASPVNPTTPSCRPPTAAMCGSDFIISDWKNFNRVIELLINWKRLMKNKIIKPWGYSITRESTMDSYGAEVTVDSDKWAHISETRLKWRFILAIMWII